MTVVGSGESGAEGVGGPATKAQLQTPVDLTFDAAGNMYIAERFGARILKVDPSGFLTVVAGTGESGFSGDRGRASEAKLSGASAIAAGPDGELYIADSFNNRIRMVDQDGVITTVAGTGKLGFSGDGGPATRATLSGPLGMAVDADGNVYFADVGNARIRMVDRKGTITTVAGTGETGFSPNGTLATEALLGHPGDHVPLGIACGRTETLHFTDGGNSRIRMIDSDVRVQSVAGNGEYELSGDGGSATKAGLTELSDIAIDSKGNLYIATHDHGSETSHRIRMVDRAGTITTIAGTGASGYAGDGGRATKAELNIPSGVAIGPDGNLYIADAVNNVIRMVAR